MGGSKSKGFDVMGVTSCWCGGQEVQMKEVVGGDVGIQCIYLFIIYLFLLVVYDV